MAAAGYPLPCTFPPLHWHVNMNGFSALARAWAGTGRRARPGCAESGLSAEAICRGHRPHSQKRLRENVGLCMYIKRPDSQSFRPDRSHLTQALACPSCVRQPHHPTAFPLVMAGGGMDHCTAHQRRPVDSRPTIFWPLASLRFDILTLTLPARPCGLWFAQCFEVANRVQYPQGLLQLRARYLGGAPRMIWLVDSQRQRPVWSN